MKPTITIKDKNVLTLTLALLTLSLVILGISFKPKNNQPEVIHSMDIILSKKSNPETPDEAEYLAQNNQLAGGTTDQKARPTNPYSATSVVDEGQAKKETQQQNKKQVSQTGNKVITTTAEQQTTHTNTNNQIKRTVTATDQQQSKEQKIAKIRDELAKKIERYAKKPRSKYVSSATKAYEYAPYINSWVKKIERTGDLNYPEQAKNKSFIGNVMLTVGIKRDGSIHEIKIIKPSDYKFLDEAAKHIVKLAQPFDPLPETSERVDILYITRTWQFLPGHLLRQK